MLESEQYFKICHAGRIIECIHQYEINERQKKTKTIPRQVRWDKLDNTAHLFPSIAGESMTNVYRISVTLKEEVQVEFLQQALDMILPKFDGFNLRMRTGVFWYYFEENGKKAPKVTEEAMFPCRFIRQNKNRNYLFRVTYYKSRINLEVFHVLTDGMGGINFLRGADVSVSASGASGTGGKRGTTERRYLSQQGGQLCPQLPQQQAKRI